MAIGKKTCDGRVPPELLAFVERQIRNSQQFSGCERRSEHRLLMPVPVLARAVDEAYNAIDEPFWLVSRDIAPSGIGLVHMDPFDEKLLVLKMSIDGEEVITAAEIQWQREMGPFYYSGAKFIEKLQRFPA